MSITPHHTPAAGTGLVGDWHVSGWLCVRADLELGAPGSLGDTGWLDDVPSVYWTTLADMQWMHTPEGLTARPGSRVQRWHQVAHLLVGTCGSGIARVQAAARPVLYRPDGSARYCRVVVAPDGSEVVVVHDGGEAVAFVPVTPPAPKVTR